MALFNNLHAQSPGDRDCDGLPDSFEDDLARNFLPPLYMEAGENCGFNLPSYGWCVDGVPAPQLKGFLGYDVVALGFASLYAIEFTMFLGYDCGIEGFGTHYFDNESFTVLLQQQGTGFQVVSVQTVCHHTEDGEQVDRYFPHELPTKYWSDGIMYSRSKHGAYCHERVCDRNIGGYEECGHDIRLVPDSHFVMQPIGDFSEPPCPCSASDWDCFRDSIQIANCWEQLLAASGIIWPLLCIRYGIMHTLNLDRKMFPPYIPPFVLDLPDNLPHVYCYEEKGFGAEPYHLEQLYSDNFSSVLVANKVPLLLVGFPHTQWWLELFGRSPQQSKDGYGLDRDFFCYTNWITNTPDLYDIGFRNNIESLRLKGLPGTSLALYDRDPGPSGSPKLILVIPDGQRVFAVSDLNSLASGLNNDIDYISWGFGPMADAGGDQNVRCVDEINLNASGSFQYAPDKMTLTSTFGFAPTFDFTKDWVFDWYDESYNKFLGSGVSIKTDLSCGKHIIRLEVSGVFVPWNDCFLRFPKTVRDWCTINVGLEAPKNVLLVSLCDAIEVYWDTVPCAFGYKVYRDGKFLDDVGPKAYCIDYISGEHQYQVLAYDIWRNECGSTSVIGIGKACPETTSSSLPHTSVDQNYPNPFNTSTRLNYSLSNGGNVKILIYNSIGQKVRTLVNEFQQSGNHFADWDGTDDEGISVSSGAYFYELQVDHFRAVRKMVMVK
jgi:hypothetical protein